MHEIENWIEEAARNQGIEIRKLAPDESRQILSEVMARYIGTLNPRPRVLWLDLARPIDEYYDRKSVKLSEVMPARSGRCWLIPETDAIDLPVFEMGAADVERLIDDCYGFEYNVVAADFSWLVIETDHDQYYVCRDSDHLPTYLS